MRVLCPSCGRAIPGDDIDLTHDRAVCRPCGELVSLSALAVAAQPSLAALRPAELGWEESTNAGGWKGTITLPRDGAWQMIGLGLFFTLVSLPFAIMIIGLLHFAVGVNALYRGLAARFNRGEASIEGGRFRFRQAPLPRRGAIDEAVDDVAGFAVQSVTPNRNFRVGPQPPWELRMATRDGRSVLVPLELQHRAHADFLAQRLNEALAAQHRGGGYRIASFEPAVDAVPAFAPDEDETRARLRG